MSILSTAQQNAVNSGITSSKVSQYDGYNDKINKIKIHSWGYNPQETYSYIEVPWGQYSSTYRRWIFAETYYFDLIDVQLCRLFTVNGDEVTPV